jgi:heterodisulfide reductase subunit A-like polyferredoxin
MSASKSHAKAASVTPLRRRLNVGLDHSHENPDERREVRLAANKPDAVVVGAGIAGASIAAFIARVGIEASLLERQLECHDRVGSAPHLSGRGRGYPIGCG